MLYNKETHLPLTRINTGDVGLITENNYVSPSLSNWRTYNDGDSNVPLDGTGGSPNVTFVRDSSAPLNSTGDYRFTKGGSASRRGQGVSVDFTVENRHLGKVLQVVFDYELVAGTLTTDDLRLYVVQDPNGTPVLVEPVNTTLQGTVSGYGSTCHVATFQTHVSLKTYRLCLHVRSTSALDYTVDFANFRVGEPAVSTGAIITDWASYTPSTTRANTNNRSFFYRRNGSNVQISFGWQYTSGASSVSTCLLTDVFPPGLTLDLNRIAPATSTGGNYSRYHIGSLFLNDYGVNNFIGSIVWDTNQNPDQLGFVAPGWSGSADDNISGWIECPIVGWGSSVAMSSDVGDSRVVAAKYNNTTSGATTSTTQPIHWGTREYDTHNAVTIGIAGSTWASGSAWKFTAPVNGYYRVTISCSTNSAPGGIAIWINNSRVGYLTYVAASNGSGTFQLNAGDIIDARADVTVTTDSGSTRFISIERVSAGSQVLAASETVACSYYSAATQTSLTSQINFGTRVYDTHGAVTTGSSWRFTAPMSGKYLVTGFIGTDSTVSSWIDSYINDVLDRRIIYTRASSGMIPFTSTFNLLAGQWFYLRPLSSMTVSGSVTIDGFRSWIEITRVGN